VAVLGAAAGLERDDPLDLDLLAAPLHPDVVREREQFRQLVVRSAEDLDQLLLAQPGALLQNLRTCHVQDLAHAFSCLIRTVGSE
jgi:hypothetical protein